MLHVLCCIICVGVWEGGDANDCINKFAIFNVGGGDKSLI